MRKFTYNLFVWESYDSGLREMKSIEVEADDDGKAGKLIAKYCGIKYPGCTWSVEEIEVPTKINYDVVMKLFQDSLED